MHDKYDCFPQRRSGDGAMRPSKPYLPLPRIPPEEFQEEVIEKKAYLTKNN